MPIIVAIISFFAAAAIAPITGTGTADETALLATFIITLLPMLLLLVRFNGQGGQNVVKIAYSRFMCMILLLIVSVATSTYGGFASGGVAVCIGPSSGARALAPELIVRATARMGTLTWSIMV